MRTNTRVAAALVAFGMLAVAGCGSSSGSSGASTKTSSATGGASGATGSGKKVDVCKIITRADAEKVAGGPVEVQPPSSAEPLASGVCIYKSTGGGIRVALLQVRVYPGPQFYGEKALPDTTSIDLSGTDKAFVRSATRGKTVDVQFVKNGRTGAVNYTDTAATTTNSASAETAVEDVAQKLANAL